MEQHLCPDCGSPFSTRGFMRDHRYNNCQGTPEASDHEVPPEMAWMLGSAVESGWYEEDF